MKLHCILLIIYFLCISVCIDAQAPEIIWQHTYGGNGDDRARDIIASDDGGYLTIGYTNSTDGDIIFNHGYNDILLVKLDSAGNTEWINTYGGSDRDYGETICKAIDGGYILGGSSQSDDGDATENNGAKDAWIIKIDESGNIEWQKSYGGSEGEEVKSIIITDDTNYVAVAFSSSEDGDVLVNNGLSDYWILKLNISGEILWQHSYGSSQTDIPYDIKQTADGGFIVAGYSEGDDGDVTLNKGDQDFWIVKLDSTGDLQWQKTYGGSSTDEAYSIVEKPEGGYLCVGVAVSNDGDISDMHGFYDYWLVSLNVSGDLEWQRAYGGTSFDDGRCIIINYFGDYILAGGSGSDDGDASENNGLGDYWILSIDVEGEIIWQKSIGGSATETAFAADKTSDNHLIITGYTSSSDIDVEETYLPPNFWTVKLGICEDVYYADADGDGFGNVLMDTIACEAPVGYVADSTDCDDTNNLMYPTAIDICNNIDDNCNGVIDEDAEFITYYADADSDGFGNVDVSIFDCAFPSGYVLDSTDCDDTNNLIYPGATELLNGVDDNCDGVIDEGLSINTLAQNTINLYPNPSNTEIYIEHTLHIIAIITRNNLGEEIPLPFVNDVADISAIPSGIYFSEIRAEEGNVVLSWVKGN